ncbi:MAG: hypothetical protein M0R80_08675 [Proteobacteria bacterium]|jgi:hypothetical protein|nr:hypothetical protein [Pseudomonadota bacterium]
MGKIYLYLGKRDKKGIKVLTVFPGKELSRAKVDNIKSLHLPPDIELALQKTIQEHRFLWEIWIEEAADFNDLKTKLEKRGYRNIPIHAEQLNPLKQFYNTTKTAPQPDISALRSKSRTMLERNSKKNLTSSNANFGNRKRTTGGFNH